jgi:hypothetical protein
MGTSEGFTVEESAALLHAIFPRYPDLRGMNPVPEIVAFLLALRSCKGASGGSSPVADFCARSQHIPLSD